MATWNSPQDFDHLLDVVSGATGMHDLQYKAPLADGEDWNRGSVLSLDASGNFKAGCGDCEMPLWAINSATDLDVVGEDGNISGGIVAAHPATGGFEFKTTEYDKTQTYIPNDFLTAALGADRGLVTRLDKSNWCSRLLLGVVSHGTEQEVYNQDVLRFWPVFIPACDCGASSSA